MLIYALLLQIKKKKDKKKHKHKHKHKHEHNHDKDKKDPSKNVSKMNLKDDTLSSSSLSEDEARNSSGIL